MGREIHLVSDAKIETTDGTATKIGGKAVVSNNDVAVPTPTPTSTVLQSAQ